MNPYVGMKVKFKLQTGFYMAKYGWIGTITRIDTYFETSARCLNVTWDTGVNGCYKLSELQYLKESENKNV